MNETLKWDPKAFLDLAREFELFDFEIYQTSKNYKEKFNQYQNYQQLIRDKIFYQKKELFFSCIIKFLTKKVSEFIFIIDLLEIYNNQLKLIENFESDLIQIQNFSIDNKIVGFASLIDDMVAEAELYRTIVFDFEESPEKHLDAFQNSIETIFLQLQEYSKTEHYYILSNYIAMG